MRTSVDLPLVTCQLKFSDGVEDIEAFKGCAATASWTNDEINVAILKAVYAVTDFDLVGEVLQQYCVGGTDARAQLHST